MFFSSKSAYCNYFWRIKDWSNDAENSALHHRIKLHFKIYSISFFSNNSEYYSFHFIYDFYQKHKNLVKHYSFYLQCMIKLFMMYIAMHYNFL